MKPLVAYNAALLREPYSGVEVVLDGTVRALAEYGSLRYRVYTPGDDVRPLPVTPRCAVTPATPPIRSRLRRVWWEQTRLPRLLRRDGAQVLHAPAYVASLAASCPVVLSVHDLHVYTHPRCCTLANRLHYRLLLPASIRRARAVIVHTAHARQALLARFPAAAAKTRVIPPGVDSRFGPAVPAAMLQAVRDRHHLPPHFLLFVGDLAPRKNLPGLLEAFASLNGGRASSRAACMHLVIAGAGAGGMDVARLAARLGLGDLVLTTGYVPPDDLPVCYVLAAALVYPSFDEGFGLPALEAMACGCPVICSPGGAAEVCGGAAEACDPVSPASIAAAIRAVLDDPVRTAARVAAGRRRAEEFRWDRTARALDQLYLEIAERP